MSFTNHAGITHQNAKPLLIASNDINGGTPHRHLTIDGNGRLLTIPYEHPNSWTNVRLATIATNTTPTYEDTDLDISALGAVGTSSASIDMNGKRHLALMIKQTATPSSGSLTNIDLEFSLDGTSWFRGNSYLSIPEVSSGVYGLYHRIEQVSARYVRLTITGLVGNPTATLCSFSRSL